MIHDQTANYILTKRGTDFDQSVHPQNKKK